MSKSRITEAEGFDETNISVFNRPSAVVYGLPFAVTSDISIRRYYKRNFYNHRIIDYALLMFEKGYGATIIAKKIALIYGLRPNHSTVLRWQQKFRPETKHPKVLSPEHKLKISRALTVYCMEKNKRKIV